MVTPDEKVYVVDDDRDVRDSLHLLLRTAGLPVVTCASAQELLDRIGPAHPGCLVLDVRLPGMNGLELQAALGVREVRMPILFISGHADIPMAVRAVNAGAFDFLEKPFDEEVLLDRIHGALEHDRAQRREEQGRRAIERLLERLTPREREVMEQMLLGRLNKVIAAELGLSVRTVEIHRARVLEKLEVHNATEMVRQVLSTGAYRDWLL
ncbi:MULTISPECIES: response regulator transcription factor [unclassified Thioalkalivibrio]|uniref:response regulator transcription factor n=1 Tax=unclassified Thioalkalivibrio TaxID=2621013 RepID=UPI000372C851|nr:MULTISPECIES: response regulator [unclassified Thioalkalivibrio]